MCNVCELVLEQNHTGLSFAVQKLMFHGNTEVEQVPLVSVCYGI